MTGFGRKATSIAGGKASGGVPKIRKPRALRKIGRKFERQMTAEAPADQARVGESERLDRRAQLSSPGS